MAKSLSVPMDVQPQSRMSVFGISIFTGALSFPLPRIGVDHRATTDSKNGS
jgi:hypothetical protein